ncbi:MAG: hypothetical protein OXQ29_15880, partial [Rhodospirillaceae bacterium]|nr:hypothetical protein [Rhodospirillaceae bacterium]
MPDALYQTRAKLEGRKKALTAELKHVNSEIAAVSDMILEAFAEEGMTNVKLDSGPTVYQHQQVRATVKAEDWEELWAICGDTNPVHVELEGMFERRINLNTLSSWVRERMAARQEHEAEIWGSHHRNEISLDVAKAQIASEVPDVLPGPLADLITIIDKPTVRVR